VKFFRDERAGALFMLFSAFFGLAAVNLVADHGSIESFKLVVWPWVSQIGMALFFALIGFELRNEFASGLFKNARAILVPALAAIFGVLVPAGAYLLLSGVTHVPANVTAAWPMVTATDVSFALMVFSLLAKGLPKPMRIFLLSFAVIDDIMATIALAFSFWRLDALTPLISTAAAMVLAFGLSPESVRKVIRWLSPFVAFAVLPVFAFFAMQIKLDLGALTSGIGAALVILFAMRPLAKWIGVFAGAVFANRIVPADAKLPLSTFHFWQVASLSGIGFTVSLLAADLAFGAASQLFAAAATLTVAASLVAVVFAVIALKVRRVSR
jgi:Na+:H+ antiporter, NhaA family